MEINNCVVKVRYQRAFLKKFTPMEMGCNPKGYLASEEYTFAYKLC